MSGKDGTIYLLHFSKPYKHARHYQHWASAGHLDSRIEAHRGGRGARLMEVIRAAGIGFELARTWPGSRAEERQIKNRHEAPAPVRGVHQQASARARARGRNGISRGKDGGKHDGRNEYGAGARGAR